MIDIIDASVAAKWFLDDDIGRDPALAVLDRVETAPRNFGVPELFFNEMLSVLCRRLGEVSRAQKLLGHLLDMGWHRLENHRECLNLAIEYTLNHGLSPYDAIYAANAKLTGGQWLTADARAHRKIKNLGISRLVA